MNPFLGELKIFPYGFVPRGWLACDGALLPINTNQALFSLLGVSYGGDGVNTFAVPDLRGRVQIHAGTNPNNGITYVVGQKAGTNSATLTLANLPAHTHGLVANASTAIVAPAANAMLSTTTALQYAPFAGNTVQNMAVTALKNTGSSTPLNITQPYLGLRICIATLGVFPPRP